ncbi:hypothetical protein SB49_10865 [Sediminicola sp. YIK13]|uniref:hypothetical protein n=1 Tax=Sediminicola sp. YIK13 TaxID=1453352 RepID=UPI00072274D1|nr:hypothetical protein [Sediminicola sp. YIK13]ALM08246.1 hypothetical protein SB49_10865 [Sediminicola sp. YIK13]
MTVKDFEVKSKAIRKEIFDESLLKQPSIYSLERVGNQLLEIVKTIISDNTELVPALESLKMDLNIYLTDLVGELQHDYNKNNKRYKAKWSNEYTKISGFISRLKEYISEKETN